MTTLLPESRWAIAASIGIAIGINDILIELAGIKTYPISEHVAMVVFSLFEAIGAVYFTLYVVALSEKGIGKLAACFPIRASVLKRAFFVALALLCLGTWTLFYAVSVWRLYV